MRSRCRSGRPTRHGAGELASSTASIGATASRAEGSDPRSTRLHGPCPRSPSPCSTRLRHRGGRWVEANYARHSKATHVAPPQQSLVPRHWPPAGEQKHPPSERLHSVLQQTDAFGVHTCPGPKQTGGATHEPARHWFGLSQPVPSGTARHCPPWQRLQVPQSVESGFP